jgi:uncharacterized membrane protein
MENLLLVLDEIDDVFSTLGLIWRPILSFVVAVALFVGTGFVFFSAPWVAEIIGLSLIALGGLEFIRQRRVARDSEQETAAPVSAASR